jgi:ferritin
MNKKLSQLIDESIKLELNVAKIYMFFCDTFPEDSDFWRRLGLEEDDHADIIKLGRDASGLCNPFPSELLASSVQMLYKTNSKLILMLNEYNKKPPPREMAFNTALNIEKSAGELHFQLAIETSPTSGIMEVLQALNNGRKDHANRILAYMYDKRIEYTVKNES